jgi:hypothetical protein
MFFLAYPAPRQRVIQVCFQVETRCFDQIPGPDPVVATRRHAKLPLIPSMS